MASVRQAYAVFGDGGPVASVDIDYSAGDIIYIGFLEGAGTADGSATVNGVDVGAAISSISSPANAFLWRYIPAGAGSGHTVTVGGTAPYGVLLVVVVQDGDTGDPNGTVQNPTGTSTAAQATLTSGPAEDLVLGMAFSTSSLTATSGTTQPAGGGVTGGGLVASVGTKAGVSGSTTLDWTVGSSDIWLVFGLNVNDGGAGGTPIEVSLGTVAGSAALPALTKEIRTLLAVLARSANIPNLTVQGDTLITLGTVAGTGAVPAFTYEKGIDLVPVTGSGDPGGTIEVRTLLGAIAGTGAVQSIDLQEIVSLGVATGAASVQALVKETRTLLAGAVGVAQVVTLTSPSGISVLLNPVTALAVLGELTKERRAQIDAVTGSASVVSLSSSKIALLEAISGSGVVIALSKEKRALLETLEGRGVLLNLSTPGGAAGGILSITDILDILGI